MAAEAVAESGPGFRQRVWVLCGGEGTQADLSLASGLHTYFELRKQPDLQVSSSTRVPQRSSHTMQTYRTANGLGACGATLLSVWSARLTTGDV